MSVQTNAFPVGARHPAKPTDAPVLWFRESMPSRAYEVVARLNVHIEKTFFIPTAFDEAKPELEAIARRHGADAIMNVEEKKSRLNETIIFNVSATAVVFKD